MILSYQVQHFMNMSQVTQKVERDWPSPHLRQFMPAQPKLICLAYTIPRVVYMNGEYDWLPLTTSIDAIGRIMTILNLLITLS